MKKIDMNRYIIWLKCIFSILYWPIFRFMNYTIQKQDLQKWCEVLIVSKYRSEFLTFIKLFATLKEYRNLVLWRGGVEWLPCPRENIHFVTKPEKIQSGLVFQHGFSTIIFAETIGCNVQIWQNVTIGRKHKYSGNPIIGNNVKICTGAIVLGSIKIGDNSIIGAGAVVTKDIPKNSVVVGNPARIIKTIQDDKF